MIVGREDVIEEVFERSIYTGDMIVGLIDRVFSGWDVDFLCFGHVIIIQSRVYSRTPLHRSSTPARVRAGLPAARVHITVSSSIGPCIELLNDYADISST